MVLKDFIQKINILESKLNINSLRIFNFNYWPYIRNHIFDLYYRDNNNSKIALISKINVLKRIFKSFFDYLSNKSVTEKEILFFTRAVDLSEKVDNKLFNKYSDSFISIVGDKVKVIQTGYFKNNRKHLFNKETQLNDFQLIWWSFLFKIKKKTRIILSDDIHDLVKTIFNFSLNKIDDLAFIYFLSKKYKHYLQKNKIKSVIIICFYRLEAMALTLACKELKINVFEYQHGAQNDFHKMYTNWKNLPSYGYELIPNTFLTWGDLSKNRIDNWADNTSYHKAKTLGNLWLSYYKNNLINNLEINKDKPIILFSLQGDINLNKDILEIIEDTHQKYNWICRPHPRIPNSDKTISILDKFSIVNTKEAGNYDLLSLLDSVNIHITGFSTVAFEAQSFSIPTIFTHLNAKNGFKELLGKNGLYYENNKNDIINKIEYLIDNKIEIKPEYMISERKIIEDNIKAIFNF